MMVRGDDMVVAIERCAFVAQSVTFISDCSHAGLKSKKQQACLATPRCANYGLPVNNVLSVIRATC